ncbi:NADH dehydrogenase [Leuconostocaceae bacterium R-53105]|uniref:NADH:ubiquinone reductase (non-electrogenic) n=2 Tax=Convivina intestini TaxID=1505726 RepID=A0A2U1D6Y1_9LACO|nr:NADH dehydrogenase FAD-containing subunit [Convivina intestini]CAH1855877.1 Nitric oxide reductase FlRd-NAD(+) reductase [Convivina intestini]SDC03480.1 NADH dehydrogenase [Leuconostocaceae bacterium R-53105]
MVYWDYNYKLSYVLKNNISQGKDMTKKNIIVVGAGFGGVFATKKLAKKLRAKKDYNIILIDKHSYMTYMTELHEVAAQRVMPGHVQEDLEHLFAHDTNVELVTAEVESIDKDNKTITTTRGTLPYEKLIISVGGQSNDFGTPGVKEFGFELWSMEESLRIRQQIENIVAQGAAESDPKRREQLLTIAVVGSGFTGAELMGEFIDQRKVLAQTYKLDESEIKLVLLEAGDAILRMLSDRRLADKAYQYMVNNGVDLRMNSKVTGVDENGVIFDDGSTLPTKSLIWTAGVKAKSAVADWGFKTGRGGRIEVDDYMHAINDDEQVNKDIYAAGDTISYVDEKTGPVPQTVEGAENAAKTASNNILNDLGLVADAKTFADLVKYHGYAVSIGSHYTVASLMKNWNFSGFFASLAKHGINLYFYSQIRSGYSIFHYMLDEFFRTANGRNPFRGTISRQGNVLWATPLRIFLGVFWILAAVESLGHLGNFYWQGGLASFLEIIAGAGLLIGLFTWSAGILSILLALAAWIFNGFDISQLFIIFGSLAVMNGSGRGFGVDFFAVPLLQKIFGKAWYGQSKSQYDDLDK